jgi:hypothetical protein
MNESALVPARTEELMFLPVMDIQVAIERRNHLVKFVQSIMKQGVDYGRIPGTSDKPTLLKPGAEKLSTFFGLTPIFIPVAIIEDWTGVDHKGEAFFYYRYRCELHRNGNLVASSEGSCNSWESKYRYRKAERVCPSCGQAAIIKGKAEYGGGWLCFGKKGGCGMKFMEGDAAIESQEVGRILNPDIADQVNTVQKMAQKRSLIAAVLLAVNASEFFTQDIEDMVVEGKWTPVANEPEPAKGKARKETSPDVNFYAEQAQGPPFTAAMPWYVHEWHKLMGKEYELVKWVATLHDKSDAPCTAEEYHYLTGIMDALTGKHHGDMLTLLCQSEISKSKMPGCKVAANLIELMSETISLKNANGNELKDNNGKVVQIPNPAYRADICEMITGMAQGVENEGA